MGATSTRSNRFLCTICFLDLLPNKCIQQHPHNMPMRNAMINNDNIKAVYMEEGCSSSTTSAARAARVKSTGPSCVSVRSTIPRIPNCNEVSHELTARAWKRNSCRQWLALNVLLLQLPAPMHFILPLPAPIASSPPLNEPCTVCHAWCAQWIPDRGSVVAINLMPSASLGQLRLRGCVVSVKLRTNGGRSLGMNDGWVNWKYRSSHLV